MTKTKTKTGKISNKISPLNDISYLSEFYVLISVTAKSGSKPQLKNLTKSRGHELC